MAILEYLLPVLAVAGLSAGWVMVQLLARRIGTKNHFDHRPGCGGCTCSGNCERGAVQD